MPEFSGVRMNSLGSMYFHEKSRGNDLCIKTSTVPRGYFVKW